MTLRQKLTAVMATAMIVTAVPVVTMAEESSNTMTSSVKTIVSNGIFDEATTDGALQIKFTGAVTQGDLNINLTGWDNTTIYIATNNN